MTFSLILWFMDIQWWYWSCVVGQWCRVEPVCVACVSQQPATSIFRIEFSSSRLLRSIGNTTFHTSPPLNRKFREEVIAYFCWYDTDHIENDASNNSSIVACVFVTAITFLPSRCLATIGEFLQSHCLATIRGFLPSRCLATIREGTHTQTGTWSHKPTFIFSK
jgi:hypothetical protein